MQILLSIYFIIFATIQFGLLIGISHYLSSQYQAKPNIYWLAALLMNLTGLGLFALGILITLDIQRPPGIFTPANVLFFAAAIAQGLFFRSLNTPIRRSLHVVCAAVIVVYAIVFEYLRRFDDFESRTFLAVVSYAVLLVWQFYEANRVYLRSRSRQLRYFQYAAIGEAIFLVPRLIVLLNTTETIRVMEQLPQLLIIFTLGQILMNTLSFIAIWGYWSEKLAFENRQTEAEKETFKKLLSERETLINSLLKVNKTSTTGALSASIAHEINQPLAAIQINSEYLQRKITEEKLDRDLINRLAADIAKDNMRAARIIRTLRAIFTETYSLIPNQVGLHEVVDSVLLLSKSDIEEKKIVVDTAIETWITLPMSFGEAQQLVLNLLNNSIAALERITQSDKRIRLSATTREEGISFRIEDNGPGVPMDQQKILFDLFSGSKRGGMGLGLWLCDYIITRHGGKIRYDAQFGQGAAFEITFPKNE